MTFPELTSYILEVLRSNAHAIGIDPLLKDERIVLGEPGVEVQPRSPSLCVYVVPGTFFVNVQAPWRFQATVAIDCYMGARKTRSESIAAANEMAMQVMKAIVADPVMNPLFDTPAITFEATAATYSICKLIFLHAYDFS